MRREWTAGTGSRHSFEVADMSPAEFVAAAGKAIAGLALGVNVAMRLEDGQLVVSVSRLGRSERRYDLIAGEGAFKAVLGSERVAPLHAPFVNGFEEVLTRVLCAVDQDRQAGST